ncbi:hypothetical protein JCM11251_001695 [Rhodosporidiobolus azoricus]
MPLLTQVDVALLLKRAETGDDVGEVLGVYAYGKQLKGRTPAQIHRSLYLLWLYLSGDGLTDVVRQHQDRFATVRALASSPEGISRLIYLATPLGIEAWNQARRPGTLRRSASSDSLDSLRSNGSQLGEEAEREIRQAFWCTKPVPYTAEPPDYVERDSPEGRRRTGDEQDDSVPLPLYTQAD